MEVTQNLPLLSITNTWAVEAKCPCAGCLPAERWIAQPSEDNMHPHTSYTRLSLSPAYKNALCAMHFMWLTDKGLALNVTSTSLPTASYQKLNLIRDMQVLPWWWACRLPSPPPLISLSPPAICTTPKQISLALRRGNSPHTGTRWPPHWWVSHLPLPKHNKSFTVISSLACCQYAVCTL